MPAVGAGGTSWGTGGHPSAHVQLLLDVPVHRRSQRPDYSRNPRHGKGLVPIAKVQVASEGGAGPAGHDTLASHPVRASPPATRMARPSTHLRQLGWHSTISTDPWPERRLAQRIARSQPLLPRCSLTARRVPERAPMRRTGFLVRILIQAACPRSPCFSLASCQSYSASIGVRYPRVECSRRALYQPSIQAHDGHAGISPFRPPVAVHELFLETPEEGFGRGVVPNIINDRVAIGGCRGLGACPG